MNAGSEKLKGKILSDLIGVSRQLEKADLGGPRFALVAREIEKALINWGQRDNTSCRVGCSQCCFQSVSVCRSEAIVLAEYVKKHNRFDRLALINSMRRQAKAKTPDEWQDLPLYYKKCVFLKNNKCSIYLFRPMGCRTHFVVTPPALCQQPKDSKETPNLVTLTYSGMAEYIHTAFSGCEGEAYRKGSQRLNLFMPQAVLQELGYSYDN
jgi:Fe-S-cluster containining protein